MDKFIKITRNTTPTGFIGDVILFNTIANIIDENKMVCIYGPRGVGKTYMVHLVLKNKNWVETTSMKDMPLLCESTCHVVVDSEKIDKSILDHRNKLSLGSTIIITNTISDIDFCECIYVPAPSVDMIVEIGKKMYPKMCINHLKQTALESCGDIRSFIFSLQFRDKRDMFKTSKDYIHDILCSNVDMISHVGKDVTDHGYLWDIVYSNHIQAGLDPDITDSLSLADVYDTRLYNNSWDMMDYFWLSAIIYPVWKMKRPLTRASLKPGVAWTKYSNFRMKSKKLSKLPPNDICSMLLYMMRTLPHEECIELLKSYNITPKDVDTINSLSFESKIPVKIIKKIKSDLSSVHP
jgi:hypothetical protein